MKTKLKKKEEKNLMLWYERREYVQGEGEYACV